MSTTGRGDSMGNRFWSGFYFGAAAGVIFGAVLLVLAQWAAS